MEFILRHRRTCEMHLGWPHLSASVAGTPTAGKLVTPPASQAFLHDLDGNLTDDEVWTYTWDAENRLVGMQHKTTLADTAARRKLAFEYDWRGRRIRRQMFPWGSTDYSATATSDQRFVYDGWNMVGVFDGSLNLQTAYVWGLDLSGTAQGAGGVGGLLAAITGTTAQFAAYDGNGNVRALADGGTGAWSAQYEYGPFGELIRATGPQAKANPFRFSTKWHDDESDLLYYGYRYYQPGTGRWISRDPINERGGLNLYGFVANSPVQTYDILGLSVGDTRHPKGKCSFDQSCRQNLAVLKRYLAAVADRSANDFTDAYRELAENAAPILPEDRYNDRVDDHRKSWNNHIEMLRQQVDQLANCVGVVAKQYYNGECGCCRTLGDKELRWLQQEAERRREGIPNEIHSTGGNGVNPVIAIGGGVLVVGGVIYFLSPPGWVTAAIGACAAAAAAAN
jgi:RHS repeat-associated protein